MLVDNDRVRVQRLSVPAGFRETLQVVPNDQIAIQVTPGDLEVVISGQKTVRSDRAGDDVLRAEERAASVPQHGQGAVRCRRRDAQVAATLPSDRLACDSLR